MLSCVIVNIYLGINYIRLSKEFVEVTVIKKLYFWVRCHENIGIKPVIQSFSKWMC